MSCGYPRRRDGVLSLSKAIGASLEDLELNDIERRDKILRRCPAVKL